MLELEKFPKHLLESDDEESGKQIKAILLRNARLLAAILEDQLDSYEEAVSTLVCAAGILMAKHVPENVFHDIGFGLFVSKVLSDCFIAGYEEGNVAFQKAQA